MVVFKDIQNLDVVRRYPVVLCDLDGVGKTLNPKQQGAFVVSEIKKNFPEKKVIAYTGGGRPELVGMIVSYADGFVKKDAGVDEWVEKLDRAILDIVNPAYIWRGYRARLLDAGVSPYQLAELEDLFVLKAIKGEPFSGTLLSEKSTNMSLPTPARELLVSIASNAGLEIAKEIFARVGT
jgi:hypothetical protein